MTLVLRHVIGHIRARWPAVDIVVRGDSHYARPKAMAWCERQRAGYIFGLACNPVLLRQVGPLAEDAALGRLAGEAEKVRRWGGVVRRRTPSPPHRNPAMVGPSPLVTGFDAGLHR